MNQQRMILAVAALGLLSAGVWAWYGNPAAPQATQASTKPSSPFQQTYTAAPAPIAASPPVPAAQPVPQPEVAPAASDSDQTATAAPAEPPSVDTPELSERKFAHGSRAEPEQI